MAHKKAGGSTNNGRDSNSKRLGVKCYGGQRVTSGSILVRQRGPRIRAGIEMGLIIPPATYLKALRLRREFRAAMNQTAQQADVLMMPATPTPAPKDLNTTGDAAFQSPWTAAGLPTVVVPSGLSDEGMPMAVQFAGPFAEEGRLLGAAHWCEQAIGLNEGPPGYP